MSNHYQIHCTQWLCRCLLRIVSLYACYTLQHAATHCNTLQHTATHCNTLQHTATTHCNGYADVSWEWSLFMCVTHCFWVFLPVDSTRCIRKCKTFSNTLPHTATHCNTLQHTTTHCNTLQCVAVTSSDYNLQIRLGTWKDGTVLHAPRCAWPKPQPLVKILKSQRTTKRTIQNVCRANSWEFHVTQPTALW